MYWIASQSALHQLWGTHAQAATQQSDEVCPSHVGQPNASTIGHPQV